MSEPSEAVPSQIGAIRDNYTYINCTYYIFEAVQGAH